MERRAQTNAAVNLAALLGTGVAAFFLSRFGHSLAGLAASFFIAAGFLVGVISWFQLGLEARERNEKIEFDELSRTSAGTTLFTTKDSEVFPAQRSREQFERYFVPAFTVALCLLEGGAAWFLWSSAAKVTDAPLPEAKVTAALFGVCFAVLFILGKFSTNIARLENIRLLKPGSAYVLADAYICLLVAAGIGAGLVMDMPRLDLVAAQIIAALFTLIALETLINLILELYRPRLKGKVERPVYESRFVSILGQPEGLVTTAAQTLDYQFGFKVSETWVYRLAVQWLPRLVLLQIVALLLSTIAVVIEPGHLAIKERMGRQTGILGPGLHFKLPWPAERIYPYATEEIQTFTVGSVPDESQRDSKMILWTIPHSLREENFLVANREHPQGGADNSTVGATNLASLLSVSIPVQFQITNVADWAYTNQDPGTMLQDLTTREVTKYLVSADYTAMLSTQRGEAADELRDRVQKAANSRNLGVNILFVGLQDLHPPLKVAADYEKVISAGYSARATVLDAETYKNRTNVLAEARATNLVATAGTEATRRITEARAQAALFGQQLPAYRAAPLVYMDREYLDVLSRNLSHTRVYLLMTSNTDNIAILNLEEKIRADLEETGAAPPRK